MQCVGVDGARQGWLAVWEQERSLEFALYTDPATLCSAHAQAAVIAVDIPIGLTDRDQRAADVLARKFVGGRRASSVFSAPVRGILDATSQAAASRRHRVIDGRGYGAQAFGILAKIRAWDALLQGDSGLRSRVYEVHPEVSFAALNGKVGLAERKHSEEGRDSRTVLLGHEFGFKRVGNLLAAVPRDMAAPDDVLDALVALWSARRIASGTAQSLPSPALVDAVGLRMAIHF